MSRGNVVAPYAIRMCPMWYYICISKGLEQRTFHTLCLGCQTQYLSNVISYQRKTSTSNTLGSVKDRYWKWVRTKKIAAISIFKGFPPKKKRRNTNWAFFQDIVLCVFAQLCRRAQLLMQTFWGHHKISFPMPFAWLKNEQFSHASPTFLHNKHEISLKDHIFHFIIDNGPLSFVVAC